MFLPLAKRTVMQRNRPVSVASELPPAHIMVLRNCARQILNVNAHERGIYDAVYYALVVSI